MAAGHCAEFSKRDYAEFVRGGLLLYRPGFYDFAEQHIRYLGGGVFAYFLFGGEGAVEKQTVLVGDGAIRTRGGRGTVFQEGLCRGRDDNRRGPYTRTGVYVGGVCDFREDFFSRDGLPQRLFGDKHIYARRAFCICDAVRQGWRLCEVRSGTVDGGCDFRGVEHSISPRAVLRGDEANWNDNTSACAIGPAFSCLCGFIRCLRGIAGRSAIAIRTGFISRFSTCYLGTATPFKLTSVCLGFSKRGWDVKIVSYGRISNNS